MSINKCNKVYKDWEKIGSNITNNSSEFLLLDDKNISTLWGDAIAKEMI